MVPADCSVPGSAGFRFGIFRQKRITRNDDAFLSPAAASAYCARWSMLRTSDPRLITSKLVRSCPELVPKLVRTSFESKHATNTTTCSTPDGCTRSPLGATRTSLQVPSASSDSPRRPSPRPSRSPPTSRSPCCRESRTCPPRSPSL